MTGERARRWIVLLAVAVLGLGGPVSARAQGVAVYITSVSQVSGDTIALSDGAVVEKTSYDYLGYLSGSDAVLFPGTYGVRLWVKGQGVLDGTLLRSPYGKPDAHAVQVTVMRSRGQGEFLELDTGELLAVDPMDAVDTQLWIGPFDALVLGDGRLVSLEQDGSIITFDAVYQRER